MSKKMQFGDYKIEYSPAEVPESLIAAKANIAVAGIPLKYFKLHGDVKDPVQATPGSACFDIFFHLQKDRVISIPSNTSAALIPTGLIFEIPEGFHLKLHERSSTCLKTDIELANKTGIIDSDYREQLFIPIRVRSQAEEDFVIIHPWEEPDAKNKLSTSRAYFQLELCENKAVGLEELKERPAKVGERKGGFGSTDTK